MSEPCLWCGEKRKEKARGYYCATATGKNCSLIHKTTCARTGELKPDGFAKCKVCKKKHPVFVALRNENHCSFTTGSDCREKFEKIRQAKYRKDNKKAIKEEKKMAKLSAKTHKKTRIITGKDLPQCSGRDITETKIPKECDGPDGKSLCAKWGGVCFENYFQDCTGYIPPRQPKQILVHAIDMARGA